MTTTEVATSANRGNLAGTGFDLQSFLRFKVVPKFYEDAGFPGWGKKRVVVTMTINQQFNVLPADFGNMRSIFIEPFGKRDELVYRGEDDNLIAQADPALVTVQAGKPAWFSYTAGDNADAVPKPRALGRVWYSCPPDRAYKSQWIYFSRPFFVDTTTPVDFVSYIPAEYQWALVDLLRMFLVEDRLGIGDDRYGAAQASYAGFLDKIKKNPQHAHARTARYAR